nr:uncharacterized protein LOC123757456 isoform X1 [Procambarus clarkii]XP_045597045.1 uncharacterized protein LOC123757456 isoform X1 [Procambarus clarkii]XP_045597046.1 uncharacterized protein LOC123757456 isoform X1 [Procambarus clarkii]
MDSRLLSSPLEAVYSTGNEKDKIALLQDSVPQLESLFNISHCIGHGTFSSVYLARTKHTTTINGRRHFAIKHIIPTSHPSRVYMELKCLRMIGGEDNVMGVTMCFREMNHIVLVMPYFPHDSFTEYVGCLNTLELQDYLINLLTALRRVHTYRVIHRDVKPANFLFNRKHRRYSLVDFGLAQDAGQKKKINPIDVGRSMTQNVTCKLSTPPVVDTLPLATHKTAKRKLGGSPGKEAGEYEKIKRSRHLSPSTSTISGILSSTTSRVNPPLRRSPRKQCSISVSPKKENFGTPVTLDCRKTPTKAHETHVPMDSPSKHTRNAEASRKIEDDNDDKGQESNTSVLEGKNEATWNLRRSPRKAPSTSLPNVPLEGLAKHLQDVTLMQVGNRTTALKIGKIKGELNTSCDSSFTSKTFCQRQRQSRSVITCSPSPRVSGIAGTPDQNGVLPKPVKSAKILQEVQTPTGSVLRPVSCHCYGSAKVCGVCAGRPNQMAPRAGTPGFRAPEVLLRHPDQGTAVDMWSVGVILLCLLSGRYPFFRAADDLSTLAEIITILGTSTVRKAAAKLGKLLTCSEDRKPLDLMKVCEILRNNTLRSRGACGNSNVKTEQCPGCYQRDICVCLAPPVKSSGSSQSSGYNGKKRIQVHGANLHKRGPIPSGSACLLSSQKRTKVQISQMMPQLYFPLFSRDSLISSINKATSLDIDCQQSVNKMNAQVTEAASTCFRKDLMETISHGMSRDILPQNVNSEFQCGSTSSACTSAVVYPPLVYHLLLKLLDPNPETRITAEEALSHPFLNPQSIH